MSDKPAAVALSLGRFRLVLGGDVGIAAMEVVADGDQTRLGLNDLRGTARRLQLHRGDSTSLDAIFVVTDPSNVAAEPVGEEVVVDIHGADDFDLVHRIHKFEPDVWKCILAEAALAAWRQRIADAADSLNELTLADAEIVGRLDIPGSPLLTELRAERRRSLNVGKAVCGLNSDGTATERLTIDLRAAVGFGAAGLAAASDGLLEDVVHSACERGSWVDRLRLLIAAEEIRAIELLVAAGAWLSDDVHDQSGGSEAVNRLLDQYVFHRQQMEELATLLADVCKRLPPVSGNPAKRFIKRKSQSQMTTVRETAEVYSGAVTGTGSLVGDASTTWDEAAQTLFELDLVTAPDTDDGSSFERRTSQSAEEAAAALGELFAQKLPNARTFVDDLASQHPGVDAEGKVQIVKRQAVLKLGKASRPDNDGPSVPETVAELAMAIALLRGIEPHTEAEFGELGLRILARAEKIANLHRQAGVAVPQAFAGFEWFARVVQPLVVEFVFNAMTGAKPARPGAARDAYKFARSKVWRARHNRGVADAAAGGASAALMKAMDTAAPRLIVRYVDRSLPAAKR